MQDEATERVLNLLKARALTNKATLLTLETAAASDAVQELRAVSELCAAAGYDETQIVIDPSIVRGLEYYTGTVFEAELTFPVTNERGEKVVFGSVGGGGRYDGWLPALKVNLFQQLVFQLVCRGF